MILKTALKNAWKPAVVVLTMVQPVFAGAPGVPAPIVGAGLPLLVLAGGAYLAVKLIRARRRD